MNIKELAHQAGFDDFPNDERGIWVTDGYWDAEFKRFSELVAEQTHTNNKAKWYQEGYEAGRQDERETCAKHFDGSDTLIYRSECAAAIRARGDKHD
jgi:hypothetical protein